MTHPLFSIITVTFNNLDGLRRTQDSLTVQECRDFEWIIVDGASRDGTPAYIKTLDALAVSEPDNGIYDAMNKGIGRAQGDYILFLNAGDALAHSATLAHIKAEIQQQPQEADFIYGDALEERLGFTPGYKKARSHTQIARGLFTHHQAMLYRRAAIGALRYDTHYKISADYKFTAQFLKNAPNALYMAKALCLFECGGVSQQRVRQGRIEQFHIRHKCQITNPVYNTAIFMIQTMTMTLRRTFPGLYWRLRERN